jgi:hypothetical protein
MGRMSAEALDLVLSDEHLPAAVGALLAGNNAILHLTNLIAFRCAGFTNLCTKLMQAV